MTAQGKFAELLNVLDGVQHLYLLLHNGPDPDCMGAAVGLQHLLRQTADCRSTIVGGGYVQRPDNRAMMEMLSIDIRKPWDVELAADAPFVCVDTQPGFSNNSLPAQARVAGVIDHHVSNSSCRAPFLDIRPEFGACASMVASYFRECDVPVNKRVATALVFAIASETRDLERIRKMAEVELYTGLLARADHPVLGQLRNPKLERGYVGTLFEAVRTTMLFPPDIAVCHLPRLPRTDDLGRIADFLDRMEVIQWTLCTERRDDGIVLSIRSSKKEARCEDVARHVIGDAGDFGGHGMMAGGIIKAPAGGAERDPVPTGELTRRFLESLGRPPEQAAESLVQTASVEQPG